MATDEKRETISTYLAPAAPRTVDDALVRSLVREAFVDLFAEGAA